MENTSYDVPCRLIAVPVIVYSVAVFYIAGKVISKKKYTCPSCGHTFYPKWWKAMFSVHINSDRVFRCPHCGTKDFCYMRPNKMKPKHVRQNFSDQE